MEDKSAEQLMNELRTLALVGHGYRITGALAIDLGQDPARGLYSLTRGYVVVAIHRGGSTEAAHYTSKDAALAAYAGYRRQPGSTS